MLINHSKYSFSDLDDIYHSTSVHEMQVKADLHAVDLADVDVLIYLIGTTTYHHAFWPHTAKRFTALKNILRHSHDLPKSKDFKRLKDNVKSRLDECEHGKWIKSTPGGRQEIKNIKQVLDILDNLERNCK